MPVVAINTLLSLIAIIVSPDLFTHSDQVIDLPEYREQATIMEEGGMLGFFLIGVLKHSRPWLTRPAGYLNTALFAAQRRIGWLPSFTKWHEFCSSMFRMSPVWRHSTR